MPNTSTRPETGDTVRIVTTDPRIGEVERLQGVTATVVSVNGRRVVVEIPGGDPRSPFCATLNGRLYLDTDEVEVVPARELVDATVAEIREEPTVVLQAMVDGEMGKLSETTLALAQQELADRQGQA